jgi:hypothetical protein
MDGRGAAGTRYGADGDIGWFSCELNDRLIAG